MNRNHFTQFVCLLSVLFCSVVFADETEPNTTEASGGDQIIVSPMNMLLDLGESGYADVLVLDEEGNPIEDRKIQIMTLPKTSFTLVS